MNWLDVIILGSLAFAVISGFRRGAIAQAFGWGGLLVGLVIGAAVGPPIVKAIHPRTDLSETSLTLGIFLGIAFVIEGILAAVGMKLRKKITNRGARHADAAIGMALAAFFSLASAWFVGIQFSHGPSREVSRAIHQSKIIQALDRFAPRPPGFLAAIGRFLDHTGFPEVFAKLNPSLAPGVAPPPASLARNMKILEAEKATYKIEGTGCGGVVDGSGFPLDPHTIITAAHVVAGTHDHIVIRPDGHHSDAIVVYMDKNKDIAVLRIVETLPKTLGFDADIAKRGSDGAAIGYPGGKKLTISVARVRTETSARGRDIYGNNIVTRDVYVLASHVIKGNSGGPFVDTDGIVRGMIFAASASDSNEAYALAGDEIDRAYSAGKARTSAVDTGNCAVD